VKPKGYSLLPYSLILVGCGKMGSALLRGWLKQGIQPSEIAVVEPFEETASFVAKNFNVKIVSAPNLISSSKSSRTIIFAIKPQSINEIIPDYARLVDENTVFLSIVAGKTVDYFKNSLGAQASIVRAMPNTPAAVGRGITVTFEGLMDAVTALSGSGPAYVFALTECMAEAGINAGLPEELAHQLARETVVGAGELLNQTSESVSELRINVTSPGGTTAEALEILLAKGGMKELLIRAVGAATRKSRELAK
jgi:pyrroline-5-carboxylate reductase